MEPIEIFIALKRAGVTQTAIARKLEVTPGFINQVISGVRHTEYIQRAIARAIKKPVREVFSVQNNKRKAA